ncbi:MAG TPA: acyl-CoA dehydrogenase family protein [Methylomirabilota bacterium]
MEFHVTDAQRDLQERARGLAADFAKRAAQHDREASDPLENYAALRAAGFYGLNVPTELGGAGIGLLGWSLAAEELGQGCASTALSFNMHLSVVGPVMESPLVPRATKERLAKMVVHEGKLIGGNFSEPTTSGLVGTAVPLTRARRVDGGYRITGRKAFAFDDRRRRLRHGAGLSRRGHLPDRRHAAAGAARGARPARRHGVGRARHAGHPQRFHGARRLLGVRRRAAGARRRHPAVPA